jgi:hypothetical protein
LNLHHGKAAPVVAANGSHYEVTAAQPGLPHHMRRQKGVACLGQVTVSGSSNKTAVA